MIYFTFFIGLGRPKGLADLNPYYDANDRDKMMQHDQDYITHFVPDAKKQRAFRAALGSFATGVTLVSTMTSQGPVGFVANSFSSLSLEPALVVWSLARSSRRFGVFAAAKTFAIHILAQDQFGVIPNFTGEGGGFAGLDRRVTSGGLPVLDGSTARFECNLYATHDGGDHLIIIGHVGQVVTSQKAPLVFLAGQYGQFLDKS